jgi:hypothetical protein
MAAMIRMIATTISNSISEKPFCFRICFPRLLRNSGLVSMTKRYEYPHFRSQRGGNQVHFGASGVAGLFSAQTESLVTFLLSPD